MGIVGLGTDLVKIDRIAALRKRFGLRFINRVFHPDEINYCMSTGNPDIHFAARFAVKEAFGKATGTGIFKLRLSDISLTNNADGRPQLILTGNTGDLCEKLGVSKTHVSISHEENFAIAVVVLEGD